MENPQKAGPLLRDLTRAFSHYNKHNLLLKKNLKETIAFFREIRQNHSNTCSTSGPELDSGQNSSGQGNNTVRICVTNYHLEEVLC